MKKSNLPTKICPVCERPLRGAKNGNVIGKTLNIALNGAWEIGTRATINHNAHRM